MVRFLNIWPLHSIIFNMFLLTICFQYSTEIVTFVHIYILHILFRLFFAIITFTVDLNESVKPFCIKTLPFFFIFMSALLFWHLSTLFCISIFFSYETIYCTIFVNKNFGVNCLDLEWLFTWFTGRSSPQCSIRKQRHEQQMVCVSCPKPFIVKTDIHLWCCTSNM